MRTLRAAHAVPSAQLGKDAMVVGPGAVLVDSFATSVVGIFEDIVVVNCEVEKLVGEPARKVARKARVLAVELRVDAEPATEARAEPAASFVLPGQTLEDGPHRLAILAANLHRTVETPHLTILLDDRSGRETASSPKRITA